ncbi:MAG: hypothetical protein OHK0039_02240 [Bacteroidia bacterium]
MHCLAGQSLTACTGTLFAFSPPQDSALHYAWSFDDPASGPDNYATLPRPTHRFDTPGSYRVRVVQTFVSGRQDTSFIDLRVYDLDRIAIAVSDTCTGDTTTLRAVLPQQDWPSWACRWQIAGVTTPFYGQELRYAFPGPGNYTASLSVEEGEGCQVQLTRTLMIEALPPAPQVQGDTVCAGRRALLQAQAATGLSVEWRQVGTAAALARAFRYQTPPLTTSATYEAATRNQAGCSSAPVEVQAFVQRAESAQIIILPGDALVLPDAEASFQIEADFPIASFSWNFGDGDLSTEARPNHTYRFPGVYEVSCRMETARGCRWISRRSLAVREHIQLGIPIGFSPNSDGYNDIFRFETTMLRSLRIEIFNRDGRLVYASDDLEFGWDGSELGSRPVPEGVYIYRIDAIDYFGNRLEDEGALTLVR